MSQNLQNFVKFQKFQFENLVDFEKCCRTHIFLQRVELQKGTESAKGTGEVDGALEGSTVVEWRCSF